MLKRVVSAPVVCFLVACGPGAAPPASPTAATSVAATAAAEELTATPEKAPPPGLTDAEAAELSSTCSPLLTAMIEGEATGLRALDEAYREAVANPDAVGLAAALDRVKSTSDGLAPGDRARCLALFERQQTRKLFEHDPAESEARSVVDSCIKRVEAVYGKQSLSFDEGGPGVAQGPFCPDDFPVPLRLSDLPYQSKKEDWDSPTWRCLQFGLRVRQRVQVEYVAPTGSGEFTCIARYRPRQGGAPIEVFRGGQRGDDGRLRLAPKPMKRRLRPKG